VVTASGRTAYSLEMARLGKTAGAAVIAIANNPGAPVFECADVAICLPTPPELIAGSTRLGAGTAQKAALNMMSTLMGVHLGHVLDGLMVNLRADNEKLRERAAGIVIKITNATAEEARAALKITDGAVKPAILMRLGAKTAKAADALITDCNGNLRAAIARLAAENPQTYDLEPNMERTQ